MILLKPPSTVNFNQRQYHALLFWAESHFYPKTCPGKKVYFLINPINMEPVADTSKQERMLYSWQRKLLPWMVGLPSVLILAFIILATQQANQLNKEIKSYGQSQIDQNLPLPNDTTDDNPVIANLEYVKWYTLAKMEEEAMDRRYSQAGVLLMARVYTVYLGFFTGMLLAIVGSVFIISKLSEKQSRIDLAYKEQVKLQFISSSPGIIFAVLGTALMIATIVQHNTIDVKDTPLFLNYPTIQQLKMPAHVPDQKTDTPNPLSK
jgi:hypothetical protein